MRKLRQINQKLVDTDFSLRHNSILIDEFLHMFWKIRITAGLPD